MKHVLIDYTNWKGERSFRTIEPISISFEENEYHKPAQWLLLAMDLDKKAERSFALKDIHSWKPVI
jgi:predicted DNA-binding transcriptional regulator YafY